ncbi:HipA domain-containing protein [Thalassotalea sp. G2M2-11]|uniref:HipA domain-containing protein n=1 Tax=Thalassotalea sp. G2M2-11 TaxID=2787627 RepID=UPI0019D28000|nr:HipA domain-containing protein [Thalassotalea sp. G2M2-11]
MTKAKEYRLDIKYAGQAIGNLSLDNTTNLLKLSYSPRWQNEGFAISPHLPLDNQHSPEVAYNFLDNALPEGEARKLLAENLGVLEKNVYSQVRAIGNDLAGAVTFLPSSEEEQNQPSFRILEEEELITRLDNKEEFGLLTWDDKPRLSVAGVQDKLNVFIDEKGNIGFGDGSLCSTHILKFEKRNCPNLVLNEFFCMKLSSAVGLPTADVEYRHFGTHPALIVKRFDRKYVVDSNKVMRRHVIDGCQALNLPRDYKYERNLGDGRDVQHIRDGASLPKLFEFSKSMSSPAKSAQWLINWQLFNLIISNYDSHGKNVSLFWGKDNSSFTPAYDLVNIAMFRQFKHVLAMAMGDEFDPIDINAYQLADFAETCDIDKKLLSRLLAELLKKVFSTLAEESFMRALIELNKFNKEEEAYLGRMKDNILSKVRHLSSQVSLIPTIDV